MRADHPGDALGPSSLTLRPIGVIRTPFKDRLSTPRQPHAAEGADGSIELFKGHDFEHALEDLEKWGRIWVLFWFHLNTSWRPKVLPPRSAKQRRGVFATRSPHRPNPVGLSTLELVEVRPLDLLLRVRGVDMIDQTPVLDIKPYVAYADAHPAAAMGWVEDLADAVPHASSQAPEPPVDPAPGFRVVWGEAARTQAAWLAEHAIDLVSPVGKILSVGPQPHPYRRIRREGTGFRLAFKDWRVDFRVDERIVHVDAVASGYRRTQVDEAGPVHRGFWAAFGGA